MRIGTLGNPPTGYLGCVLRGKPYLTSLWTRVNAPMAGRGERTEGAAPVHLVERRAVKRAGAWGLHVVERPRRDDAVVVAAVARPDADQLVGLGIDEGNAAR